MSRLVPARNVVLVETIAVTVGDKSLPSEGGRWEDPSLGGVVSLPVNVGILCIGHAYRVQRKV